ncbi:MAG: hypothetical protein ABI592_01145 [Acidobacteriota bacterium]
MDEFSASDASVVREIRRREASIADAAVELNRLQRQAVESAGGVVQATEVSATVRPETPPPVSDAQTPQDIANEIIRNRDEASALGQALATFSTDPEASLDLMRARGVNVVFENGVPMLAGPDGNVAIDRETLKSVGRIPAGLLRAQGAPGSGGRASAEAMKPPDGRTIVQRGADDFRVYQANRDAIFIAKFGERAPR